MKDEEFIKFKYFRFADVDIIDYLDANYGRIISAGRRETQSGEGSLAMDKLEDAHKYFMMRQKALA